MLSCGLTGPLRFRPAELHTRGAQLATSEDPLATILFSYEFGAGLGHLTPLLAVARRLSERHRLVFALPDMESAEPAIRRAVGERAELLPQPRWRPVPDGPGRHLILADALYSGGLGDPEQVKATAERWRGVLSEVRPDLLVADFAPGLRLAAGGPPLIEVGYGYTVPPPGRLLPSLRPWNEEIPADSRVREFDLLATVNRVRQAIGGPRIDYLADLFQGERTYVCTLPQFDMYRAYRETPHLPPIMNRIVCGPQAERRTGPDIFLYMHASHPRLLELLQALTLTNRPCAVYVSSAPADEVARRCGKNVAVYTRPADFRTLLPQTKLSVHHGGLGSSHAALAAGTPQLMFPTRLEWQVNARAVEQLGAGHRHAAKPSGSPEALADVLNEVANNWMLMRDARQASVVLQDYFNTDAAATIAAECEWMLP